MNIQGIELAPGQNDDLGRLCKELIEHTLKSGKIKDAQAIVKGVYKQSLGARKSGKGPNFSLPKPPVQDRMVAQGKRQ
jgi:hypothetical protein